MLGERDEQLTFGDLAYEHIPRDHPLKLISQVVDFSFVSDLVAESYGATGRPGYEPEVLFRMLFLAFWGNWSDRQCEENVRLNLAAKWFVGLHAEDEPADHTTLHRFRERLGEGRVKEIFERLVEQIDDAKLLKRAVQILDSTPIEADADRTKVDWEGWDKQGPLAGSPDPDARFGRRSEAKKGSFFGYKQHLAMAADSGLITRVFVTPGNVLDLELFEQLVDRQAEAIIADRGYDSDANHALLLPLGIRDGICYRRGEQRAGWVRRRVEEELCRQRWRIEGKFAEQKRWHGMGRARYRGLRKVTFQALMVAWVVNVKRLVKILAEKGLLGRPRFGRRLEWVGAAA